MSNTSTFTGLPMPVFTAFGWAGEENAINFALSNLEQFINTLYPKLPLEARGEFHHHGISQEAQSGFLAMKRDIESGPYITFNARPMTFEMKFTISNKAVINKGLRAGEKKPADWHHLLTELGPSWSLNLQQYLVDEETEEASYYHDLFKDGVNALTPDQCKEMTARAAFLNSEAKWITPFHLSYRIKSDVASGMGDGIIEHIIPEIMRLLPIMRLFTQATNGGAKPTKSRSTSKNGAARRGGRKPKVEAVKSATEADSKPNHFVFETELKPLQLRKGFINLTPQHWPFFSTGARSELRDVSVYVDGKYDKGCAVWRLQPNDQARLVLSDDAQVWLSNSFEANQQIRIEANRLDSDEIQIQLKPVGE